MELWERVQVNIAVVDVHLPTKDCSVDPQVAMRKLHTLRTRCCSTGVVDGCSGIFIWHPCGRLGVVLVQDGVRPRTNNKLVLGGHRRKRLFKFWVDE